MNIDALNEQFGITHIATFITGKGDLPCIQITSKLANATIYLHGGHITHWQPAGEDPVLFMNDRSWFEVGKPIRGGVPICFPWFGAHPLDDSLPSHGIVRTQQWDVESITEDQAGSVIVTLLTQSDDASYALWPFEFELRHIITIGSTLSLNLQTHNTDEKELKITQALHTYLAVKEIHEVQIAGLEGRPYFDKVADQNTHAPNAPLHLTGEFDSVFCDTQATVMVIDPQMKREISVAKQGSDSTIIWNPWVNKSKELPDMADSQWQNMVCVETANAGHNIVTVQPGQQHEMISTISVAKLGYTHRQ